MARRYFGTDGVRGIAGEFLTVDLVERLGRAAVLWRGAERVFVGRDTRASGLEFEAALAEGIASAGATAILGGVLPTPAVALGSLDLGAVITASHNPAEYNGVKFFDADGSKLTDAEEEQIEALLDLPAAPERGRVERAGDAGAEYVAEIIGRFGADLTGLRIVVDCANGAYSALAPEAFERLGAEVTAIGVAPDGSNINAGCGATDTRLLQRTVTGAGAMLGVAFDGDGDRIVAVDERGEVVDGDGIVAILALDLRVERVAVTQMTNLGFHALMARHGIVVDTTEVGDRYVLEALRREGAILGGEQSGHVIYLRDHVSGDGLTAVASKELTPAVLAAVEAANAELGATGRVLVRPSGTEPLVRVLVEADDGEVAERACATIARLVENELG
jgi:phosphoglucosamine mutase